MSCSVFWNALHVLVENPSEGWRPSGPRGNFGSFLRPQSGQKRLLRPNSAYKMLQKRAVQWKEAICLWRRP